MPTVADHYSGQLDDGTTARFTKTEQLSSMRSARSSTVAPPR